MSVKVREFEVNVLDLVLLGYSTFKLTCGYTIFMGKQVPHIRQACSNHQTT